MSLRSWISRVWVNARAIAEAPQFYNPDCLNCGHEWMVHSFYGITRSECHEGTCECIYYTNSYMETARKCRWCDETGIPVDILIHEVKEHPEWAL